MPVWGYIENIAIGWTLLGLLFAATVIVRLLFFASGKTARNHEYDGKDRSPVAISDPKRNNTFHKE